MHIISQELIEAFGEFLDVAVVAGFAPEVSYHGPASELTVRLSLHTLDGDEWFSVTYSSDDPELTRHVYACVRTLHQHRLQNSS